MRTNILIPIIIIGAALAALGVVAYKSIAPPPLVANNPATPSVPASLPPKEDANPDTSTRDIGTSATATEATTSNQNGGKDPGAGAVPPLADSKTFVAPTCKVSGCSGEVCEDSSAPESASTCIFKSEYQCYKTVGRCEKQKTGHCGWSMTPDLSACQASHQDSNQSQIQ